MRHFIAWKTPMTFSSAKNYEVISIPFFENFWSVQSLDFPASINCDIRHFCHLSWISDWEDLVPCEKTSAALEFCLTKFVTLTIVLWSPVYLPFVFLGIHWFCFLGISLVPNTMFPGKIEHLFPLGGQKQKNWQVWSLVTFFSCHLKVMKLCTVTKLGNT